MTTKPAPKKNATKPTKSPVIVRTYSAGVHFGYQESRDGKEITLSGARRIWRWQGANTLHEVATTGIARGSKVSVPVSQITLTESIEIIACTPAAVTSIEAVGWES
jgi:hypothetical protein